MYNGVSYDKNESYAIGNSYTRTSARTNFDWTPSDKVKVLLSGSTSEGRNQRVRGGWSGGIGTAMSTALLTWRRTWSIPRLTPTAAWSRPSGTTN